MSVIEPTTHPRDGHPDLIVTEADARLIAAAPALYEALNQFVEIIDRDEPLSAQEWAKFDDWLQHARAILSQATASGGEESIRSLAKDGGT